MNNDQLYSEIKDILLDLPSSEVFEIYNQVVSQYSPDLHRRPEVKMMPNDKNSWHHNERVKLILEHHPKFNVWKSSWSDEQIDKALQEVKFAGKDSFLKTIGNFKTKEELRESKLHLIECFSSTKEKTDE
jgi:hypothetical protein